MAEAATGNCGAANQAANAALGMVKGREQTSLAALAFAFCGDSAKADTMINDLVTRFPRDTAINAVELPTVRAFTELNRNNPDRVIQLLEPVRRYEKGEFALFWPNYLRGLAYLKAKRPAEAVAEFQIILNHRSTTFMTVLHPLSQLQLARAWAMAARDQNTSANGNALASARKAYQDFLAIWKDADANHPILQQAKDEYAN